MIRCHNQTKRKMIVSIFRRRGKQLNRLDSIIDKNNIPKDKSAIQRQLSDESQQLSQSSSRSPDRGCRACIRVSLVFSIVNWLCYINVRLCLWLCLALWSRWYRCILCRSVCACAFRCINTSQLTVHGSPAIWRFISQIVSCLQIAWQKENFAVENWW